MNSVFASLEQSSAPRFVAGWKPIRRLRALRDRFGDALRDETDRAARLMSLDARRIFALAGAIGLLAVLGGVADTWLTHREAAKQGASAAMMFVEKRLDEIDHELSNLAADPNFDMPVEHCSATLTGILVRASLSSTLVRKFFVATDGTSFTCGPEGEGAALTLTHRSGTALALSTTRDAAKQLMVQRIDRGGIVMIATLDPRAFDQPGGFAEVSTKNEALRIGLLSADGNRLATLGSAQPNAEVMPGLRILERALRRDVTVVADIDTALLISSGWRYVIWYLVTAGMVVLVSIVLAWQHALRRARLSYRIERALRKREFEPYVQPIVDLATGRCTGAEVLMRWHHPQRGMLAPGEFIEEAERTGLILGMSDLVMSRAIHRLAPTAQVHPDMHFSFNVTPAQLRHPHFARRLEELFRPDTLPRDQALLELTEREFIDPAACEMLASLHTAGWRIAIDDFGTGQSSLASLEALHADRIKIDRAFVMTVDEQTASRPVLNAIIKLGMQLNVGLVAEGVETQAQWDYLMSRGVQYAQGYLIARPMPIDAFIQWLAAQQRAEPTATAELHRSVPAPDAPIVDVLAQQLWHDMRTPGGLDIRDRVFRLRSYPSCFVGREAVDWLVRHRGVDRAEAVRLGKRLMALGLMSHVMSEHDFKDADLFYRLALPARHQRASLPAASDLKSSITGPTGVPVRTHARGLICHKRCTTGRKIVDWMTVTYRVPRPTARQWASQLMREGALRHVFDDQPFRDDRTLYRSADSARHF